MTDGNNTCGEHSITYRDSESLCSMPETSIIYSTQIKNEIKCKKVTRLKQKKYR